MSPRAPSPPFRTLMRLFFCKANLRRLFGLIVFKPVSWLARVIPKTNIVVIGARYGAYYDWDPKYVFEYLLAHPDEHRLRPYWVARKRALYRALKEAGKPVLLLYRPGDVWKVMRAKIAVISTSPGDIDLHLISGAILVHTYHGIPIRKVANEYLDHYRGQIHGGWKAAFANLCMKFYYAVRVEAKADYIITTSEGANRIWQQQYRHDPSKYRVLGMPRNDALFLPPADPIKRDNELILAYLPTFRGTAGETTSGIEELFLHHGFDADRFAGFLREHRIRFLLKCHHRQLAGDILHTVFGNHECFELYAGQDVIPLLRETDLLITDYSSVIWHYLLLDRPAIFAPFDLDEYRRALGFTLDYEDFMPGPICRSWPEVLAELAAVLEHDAYADKRKKARDFMYAHVDGNTCQRVCAFLEELNQGRHWRSP